MDLITKETAEKTTWMILEGLGYSKKNNTDLVKTVHEIFDTAPIAKDFYYEIARRISYKMACVLCVCACSDCALIARGGKKCVQHLYDWLTEENNADKS